MFQGGVVRLYQVESVNPAVTLSNPSEGEVVELNAKISRLEESICALADHLDIFRFVEIKLSYKICPLPGSDEPKFIKPATPFRDLVSV